MKLVSNTSRLGNVYVCTIILHMNNFSFVTIVELRTQKKDQSLEKWYNIHVFCNKTCCFTLHQNMASMTNLYNYNGITDLNND